LDIGGGSNPIKNRVKNWDVKNYRILDNNAEGEFEPDYEINMNYKTTKLPLNYFDLIFCLELYEYLWNPIQATQNIYKLLKKRSKAIISFPFIYPFHNPINIDYLRYTPRGAEKLLQEAGFVNIEFVLSRRDKSGLLEQFYRADGMRCAKGIEHNITGFVVEAKK